MVKILLTIGVKSDRIRMLKEYLWMRVKFFVMRGAYGEELAFADVYLKAVVGGGRKNGKYGKFEY